MTKARFALVGIIAVAALALVIADLEAQGPLRRLLQRRRSPSTPGLA